MEILVICEDPNTAKEIVGKAKELADGIGGKVAYLAPSPDTIAAAGDIGADAVFKLAGAPENFNVEQITNAAAAFIEQEDPKFILVGSTKEAKELGPRIAARLDKPIGMDATDIRIADGKMEVDRIVYGGNGVETLQFAEEPAIASVAPRTFKAPDGASAGSVSDFSPELGDTKVTVTSVEKKEGGNVQLEAATVIAACGRGVKDKKDLDMITELAKTIGGELGCSRPIASDLEWLPVDHWVGLSGKRVKPSLYIACGISGQIQHLAGMRDSKIIVAINKDENAPILKAADYYIIGDIYKIVPELTEKLKK